MKQKRPSLFDDAGFNLNAFDVRIFDVKISPVHFHQKSIRRFAFSVISVHEGEDEKFKSESEEIKK